MGKAGDKKKNLLPARKKEFALVPQSCNDIHFFMQISGKRKNESRGKCGKGEIEVYTIFASFPF